MDIDVIGQPGIGIAVINHLAQRAKVIDTGQAFDTGFFIQQHINLIDAHLRLTRQMKDDAGVNITGAGTHDQTRERR